MNKIGTSLVLALGTISIAARLALAAVGTGFGRGQTLDVSDALSNARSEAPAIAAPAASPVVSQPDDRDHRYTTAEMDDKFSYVEVDYPQIVIGDWKLDAFNGKPRNDLADVIRISARENEYGRFTLNAKDSQYLPVPANEVVIDVDGRAHYAFATQEAGAGAGSPAMRHAWDVVCGLIGHNTMMCRAIDRKKSSATPSDEHVSVAYYGFTRVPAPQVPVVTSPTADAKAEAAHSWKEQRERVEPCTYTSYGYRFNPYTGKYGYTNAPRSGSQTVIVEITHNGSETSTREISRSTCR